MYKNYHLKEIPIELIEPNPYQPRQVFDDDMIQDLADSIEIYGVMQPITVRRLDNKKYELIAGERRLRAAKKVGLKKIPVIIQQVDKKSSAVLALVENIQRENLSYIEEAEAYQKLIHDYSFIQQEIANRVGKSQSTIANKLRLLKLSEKVRQSIRAHQLTERHARALLKIEDEAFQLKVIDEIIKQELNVKKTEAYINRLLNEKEKPKKSAVTIKKYLKDIRIIDNTIKQTVDMLRNTGLEVNYETMEQEDVYEITIKIPFKD